MPMSVTACASELTTRLIGNDSATKWATGGTVGDLMKEIKDYTIKEFGSWPGFTADGADPTQPTTPTNPNP